jgi:hypothetical protein
MDNNKWMVIEQFVLDNPMFDSDDFEEFLEVINHV